MNFLTHLKCVTHVKYTRAVTVYKNNYTTCNGLYKL